MGPRVRWRVVTWSTTTDREFDTRQGALDYVRDPKNKPNDWHIEPIHEREQSHG